jgi:hypothetical protein
MPVMTLVAVAAPPKLPKPPPRLVEPLFPPFAMVEPRRELAITSLTVSVELAFPPGPGKVEENPEPPLPP